MVKLMDDFKKKFFSETVSFKNKNKNQVASNKDARSPFEMLSDEDKVAYDLIKLSETKIHERVCQKFNL